MKLKIKVRRHRAVATDSIVDSSIIDSTSRALIIAKVANAMTILAKIVDPSTSQRMDLIRINTAKLDAIRRCYTAVKRTWERSVIRTALQKAMSIIKEGIGFNLLKVALETVK